RAGLAGMKRAPSLVVGIDHLGGARCDPDQNDPRTGVDVLERRVIDLHVAACIHQQARVAHHRRRRTHKESARTFRSSLFSLFDVSWSTTGPPACWNQSEAHSRSSSWVAAQKSSNRASLASSL